ncbi:MAG: hypothetical protein JNG83_06000 [Opitutaceae bacterium]|nr:hypothetical protein [Opitutaceae bacterium]
MNLAYLHALEAQRPQIRAGWEHLLRLERANSPLANPDTLVHLLDTTLNEIFLDLRLWSPRRRPSHLAAPACPCGRNPLLAYFAAGRQALHEALVVVQAAAPEVTPDQRSEAMACLDQVFSRIARREIESFCALCQFRPSPVTHAHDPADYGH